MLKKSLATIALALIAISMAGVASADIVCPDSSYVCVDFTKTYTNNYNKGQPYDYVTVSPNGAGETFSGTGITIRVYLKNCQGAALPGVPAQEVILFNTALCICPGGNGADAFTDANGCTQFSGTMRAGGCVSSLTCFADGVSLGTVQRNGKCGTTADFRTVKINSTDAGVSSPCFTDASDLAALATKLGSVPNYNICFDYNETGTVIDASDLAFFASLLGAACQ